MDIFEMRLEEFKKLNNKRNPSASYMQGLTMLEYSKINSLHAFLMSSEKGKQAYKKLINETKIPHNNP